MAKAQYVKVEINSNSKSLAGYKVLGDITENGKRVLVLEAPQAAAKPKITRTRRVVDTPVAASAAA
jgi:hypothetical protein